MTGIDVLVVEDEPNLRELIQDILGEEGLRTVAVASVAEARVRLAQSLPDVLLLDVKLPDGDGLQLLAELRAEQVLVPAVVMTAFGTVERAVSAMHAGASDFVVKPFDTGRLLAAVASARQAGLRLDETLVEVPEVVESDVELIGSKGGLQKVVAMLPRVAATDATVLVLGESGTGKELVARALHDASSRRDGPFVSINCAALPATLLESELFGFERGAFTGAQAAKKGLFETADGGTIFLDEVGDMPLDAQAKLLRVLQEREVVRVGGRAPVKVDVRVVAATHRHLPERVSAGEFRQDLYFRLDVVPVRLPPLRERRQDLLGLVDHFLERHLERHGGVRPRLDETARRALMGHSWPGNVRELENWVERAVVLGRFDAEALARSAPQVAPSESEPSTNRTETSVEAESEASDDDAPTTLRAAVAAAERAAVVAALRACEGNKAAAARRLGVSYKTLFNKIHEHGIRLAQRID